MKGKILFGFTMFWLLGILTGWTFSGMAYNPNACISRQRDKPIRARQIEAHQEV